IKKRIRGEMTVSVGHFQDAGFLQLQKPSSTGVLSIMISISLHSPPTLVFVLLPPLYAKSDLLLPPVDAAMTSCLMSPSSKCEILLHRCVLIASWTRSESRSRYRVATPTQLHTWPNLPQRLFSG